MSVENMTFMLDRLHRDCSPLQYVRELTQNGIEAIEELTPNRGEVIWDVDWNRFALTHSSKLVVIDTGVGMTGEEMVHYINRLSSSIHAQSMEANFGVGAKVAAVPRNHAGIIYLSWKNGSGYMTISGAIQLLVFTDCGALIAQTAVRNIGRAKRPRAAAFSILFPAGQ